MQPYFFPYIGYFQLINAVDTFIFYDDVNYIKNGWINRNRFLINKEPHYITIPCPNASSFIPINKVEYRVTEKQKLKMFKTLEQNYAKAPFKNKVLDVFFNVLNIDSNYVSDLAIQSIVKVAKYLMLTTNFIISSNKEFYSRDKSVQDNIIDICKNENADIYINLIGGSKIYSKNYFKRKNISLEFLIPGSVYYKQYDNKFVDSLSIIDVMMFNSPNSIRDMLDNYDLV